MLFFPPIYDSTRRKPAGKKEKTIPFFLLPRMLEKTALGLSSFHIAFSGTSTWGMSEFRLKV